VCILRQMDITPGQLSLPFVPEFQAWSCALEALNGVRELLVEAPIEWLDYSRSCEELERIMVLADSLAAALLAP